MSVYCLWFDGSCTKEPVRSASFGYVLCRDGKEIDRGYGLIGRGKYMTEVVGEYYGLSAGLDSFVRHWDKPRSVLNIYGDSKFVLRQIKKEIHEFRELQFIQLKLNQIRMYGVKVNLHWLPRKSNKLAHHLAHKLGEQNQGS